MAVLFEKLVSSRVLYEGKVVRVTLDEVELQNGRPALREVVHHNGGACVVALDDAGRVALVQQYRHAVGRVMLELPAGKIEPGEDPRQAALRELGEEVGLQAAAVEDFGSILPTCGYSSERIYIYKATGLRAVPRHPDEDEFVEPVWMSLDDAIAMVMAGGIDDAKTVSGLLRAKLGG